MCSFRLYNPTTPGHCELLGTFKGSLAGKEKLEAAGFIVVDAADPELR